MKKFVALCLFFGTIGFASITAQASKWHQGTPSFLVNHTYRVRIEKGNPQGIISPFNTLTSTRRTIKFVSQQNGLSIHKPKFISSHSGKTYIIKGNAGSAGQQTIKINRLNKHKVTYSVKNGNTWFKWGKSLTLIK